MNSKFQIPHFNLREWKLLDLNLKLIIQDLTTLFWNEQTKYLTVAALKANNAVCVRII